MRLETKYGVLEGTVEEFKELLEGEKDLSFFSGKVDLAWMEEDKYRVVKEDLYSNLEGLVLLEKGTVLLETEHHLEDSLGNAYCLHPDTIENKLKEFYIVGIRFHFEEHKRNNKLYKLTLPKNQF